MRRDVDLVTRIVNYALIVAVLVWLLFAVSVLTKYALNLGVVVLLLVFATLAFSLFGVWRYDRFSYKVVIIVSSLVLVVDWVFGRGIGPEVVPLLLALYLVTKVSKNVKAYRQVN